MRLVVGLGNPGKKYQLNRHNLGFLVVEALANGAGVSFRKESRFDGEIAKANLKGKSVYFLKPTTYMNDSGRAVRKVVDYYKLSPQEVLILVDDIALPYEQMRLREQGSAGGHNGLKSIAQYLGTQAYPRLRLGIGAARSELTNHVLGDFSSKEQKALPSYIAEAMRVVEELLEKPVADVMKKVNTKSETSRLTGQENKTNGRTTRREEGQETTVRGDVHSQRSAE